MKDNVILLGAGASHAAGIPMLNNFMQTIKNLAAKGMCGQVRLTEKEIEILQKAVDIRDSLDTYHARVGFNNASIEDMLSMLSFESLAGSVESEQKLRDFTEAIVLTIEMTCAVEHDGTLNVSSNIGDDQYRGFWRGLFGAHQQGMTEMPAIISFNYDLVLERALLQTIIGHPVKKQIDILRSKNLVIRYAHEHCETCSFEVEDAKWEWHDANHEFRSEWGLKLVVAESLTPDRPIIEIPLIKPHGSLNFPKSPKAEGWRFVHPVKDPAILPPVFNKASFESGRPIWRLGMEALRDCRNLIICGYSLPITDSYMQYFLKSALGPNKNLDAIYVFDPVLFKGGQAGTELRERYSKCFSSQFQQQIHFQPETKDITAEPGTFAHMVELFENRPEYLLFGPTGPVVAKQTSNQQFVALTSDLAKNRRQQQAQRRIYM